MKCERCQRLVRVEDYVYTGEFTKTCLHCGQYNSHLMLRDEEGEYLVDEKGPIFTDVNFEHPCGAYYIYFSDGRVDYGTLGDGLTEEDVLKNLHLEVFETEVDIDKSYVLYRNPETNTYKRLFGNGKAAEYEKSKADEDVISYRCHHNRMRYYIN